MTKVRSHRTAVMAVLMAVLPAAVIAGPPLARAGSGLEEEQGGWLQSGTKSQPYDVAAATRGLEGISTRILCPALRPGALLSAGDTLWIGTEGGLFAWSARTDSLFRVEGPAFCGIDAIERDDEGRLWVGGGEGVSVRGEYGWSHYTSERYSFFERVSGFNASDDRFWITTFGKGLGYFSEDTLTVVTRADSLLDDRVSDVIEQQDETLWIGTESGLCRADSFSWQSLRYGAGIPVGPVRDLVLDEEGNLFMAIPGQGVARYNLGRVDRYLARDGLPSLWMRRFSIDPAGTVWAVGRGGASVFDGSGFTPVRLPGAGLAGRDILSVCHDTEGNTFMGAAGGSLMMISGDSMQEKMLPQDFPISTVLDIREKEGRLWFMSGSAIAGQGAGPPMILPPGPWYEGTLTSMAFDRSGSMWVTTRFGILRYDGRSWEVFDRRLGLPTDHFTWVEPSGREDIWFGTFDSGLLKLDSRGWTHYTPDNGIPPGRIVGMEVDEGGREWILSESGKIAVRDGGSWRMIDIPPGGVRRRAADADTLSSLYRGIRYVSGSGPDDSATSGVKGLCIGSDGQGDVLICRSDGIFSHSSEGWRMTALPYGGERIEPSSITGSRRGTIWMGTAGQGLFIRRGGDWMRLGPSSGLSDGHITKIMEDESGRIWCGTLKGGVTVCDEGH